MANKKYDGYSTSYSGTDMVVSMVFPNSAPLIMGTSTTITYSVFRQLAQVRTMGRITPRGFARGGRSYAGTIIFTVINESFVEEVRRRLPMLGKYKKLTADEFPPVDIILTFGNEFGQSASLNLYGVRFVDETKTLSIEDIFTENIFTFICEEVHHMKANESSMQYDGVQQLRGNGEHLGKFKVSELLANIEDEERRKRLQEIADAEKERWKEPVMKDPGTVPNFDIGAGGSGAQGPSVPEGEGNESGLQNDGSVMYAVNVRVWTSDGKKTISGASVSAKINGATVKKTTNKDGVATFGSITKANKGKTLTFTISKSGHITTTKNKKIGVDGASTENIPVYMQAVSNAPSGMGPPSSDVTMTKKYGAYSNYDSYSKKKNGKWLFDTKDSKDRVQVQLLNKDGDPLAGVDVYWTYKIDNFGDLGFSLFDVKYYKDETGAIAKSTTDKNGVATLTPVNLGSWHNDARIVIFAKPKNNKNNNANAAQSLWQKFTFY